VAIAAAPVAGMLQSARLDLAVRPENPFERPLDADRPRYSEMIDPDKMEREQRCLAEAVYFEARSEPEEGQAAVAQVVLNRVRSGLYPGSICGVVYQNRHRHLACQFTFACEGKSLRISDRDSWASAKRVAESVLEGRTYLEDVGSSTHYHADYVRPRWARKLKKMDVIGRHIFYKLRPGQT
jgi:spore germination cell wall hydrolase CwlJ-like protein